MNKPLEIINRIQKVELATADQIAARVNIMEKTVDDADRIYTNAMAEANQFFYAAQSYNKAIKEAILTFNYLKGSDIYLKDLEKIKAQIAKAEKELGVNVPEPIDIAKAERIIKESMSWASKLKTIVDKFKEVKV
jgi:hypothetical protein